ncbi:serine/threonine-protein kinase [Leptothoe kymatousa]|uniref:non-specific serine/threonine protein kinase n=1 Tax=Leptothoe kymatousa TAU-MAC 1615 TaxID=2364775 RepID=A0ABS5Y200_9CYAN|nr:serine/threonine-protein kinase [Leptothoe kymatousa]MBT9311857.1 serine/threonine protein kinase [Leptothoe kymatousa TAU-MAC 1615]
MSTPWESSPPLGARYNVLQEIGEGGFGRTYLAEDLHRFKERCVLKEFVPQIEDPSLLAKAEELFEREAKVLYQLEHPQIPKFRELMREGGKLFLVQDYVEGTTYRSLLQGRQDYGGQFSETEVTQLMYQLLPVLEYIHGLDIIHRDISPENLILRAEDGKPVLIDFGSVKQIAATVEQELSTNVNQTRIGKAGYVPQEQFHSGAVDPSSDLYGLAATLVVLATGKEPQALQDIYDNTWNWDQFVALGEPLNSVLKKMLAPSPAQRYGSAAQVLQALHGAVPAEPQEATNADDYGVAFVGAVDGDENGGAEGLRIEGPHTSGATQVVAPPPDSATVSPAAVGPARQTNSRSGLEALLGLLALLGIVGLLVGLFGGLGLRPRLPSFGNQSGSSDAQQPQRGLNADEVARKEELLQRRQNLGVNEAWLNQWVNQQFYDQYPNLRGRPLTPAVEDAPLRLRWDNLAMDSLDSLQLNLSMPARRGLGAYGADDRESWRKLVNNLNVSSRALEDLSDAKFAATFPKTPRDRVLDQPLGQVWYAMTQDSVEDLQSGKALELIEFDSGTFRDQRTGQLAVGQGQVFVLKLEEGQNLRINLQAPQDAVQMSLYLPAPSQKLPFLLSDSSETTWSGRLEQTGFYEIAIASKSANPINYALSVAVDNISNTPAPEESPKPTEGDPPKPEDKQPEDPETETPAPEEETPSPENEAQQPKAGDSTPGDSETTAGDDNPVSF